jgi:hypothetical protein
MPEFAHATAVTICFAHIIHSLPEQRVTQSSLDSGPD